MVVASVWWLGSLQTRPASQPTNAPEQPVFDLTPRLQQSDEQFGYEVVSRALDRSADGNRFFDTLFFALMAAQVALCAIVFDRFKAYAIEGVELLLAGFVLAIFGTALTLLVRDGPNPERFSEDFPSDPSGSRRRYVDIHVADAKRNERLRVAKAFVLAVSLMLTVAPLIIATAARAHGVSRGSKMQKIDVSCYFRPDRLDPKAPDPVEANAPNSDPNYSVVFGYGFSKSPKTRPQEPSDRNKAD